MKPSRETGTDKLINSLKPASAFRHFSRAAFSADGGVLIELAVCLAVLLTLLMGAVNFNAVFTEQERLFEAVSTGARSGAQDPVDPVNAALTATRRSLEVSGLDPAEYRYNIRTLSLDIPSGRSVPAIKVFVSKSSTKPPLGRCVSSTFMLEAPEAAGNYFTPDDICFPAAR